MRRWLLVVAVALAACGGEEEGPASEWSSLQERPCPEGSVLDWENFGAPFLQNWCTGCHSADVAGPARYGAPVGIDLETPASARHHAARIWARAADGNETMPPAGGPGAEERRLLGEWLACGAP